MGADLLSTAWEGRRPGARILSAALAPAELAFSLGSGLYHAAYSRGWMRAERAGIPVVSVGNLTVGGTGKTPITRWVADRLRALGARPAILHGGYAEDEPELHRLWSPDLLVLARRARLDAAREAADRGASVVVLDDAFQHRKLARDLDIVLVAAESWTGRTRLLPRGRWRERPAALARAHAVVVTRKTASAGRSREVLRELRAFAPTAAGCQVHLASSGWLRPDGTRVAAGPEGPVLAVCAIAGPEGFLENARAAGADVGDVVVYRDHHAYDASDAAHIRERARGRPVVTTAKDWVKLRCFGLEPVLWTLEQRVEVEHGGAALDALLRRVCRP